MQWAILWRDPEEGHPCCSRGLCLERAHRANPQMQLPRQFFLKCLGNRLAFDTSLPCLIWCFHRSSSISVIKSFYLCFPVLILSLSSHSILTNLEDISIRDVLHSNDVADKPYANWDKSRNPWGHGEVLGTKGKTSWGGIISDRV